MVRRSFALVLFLLIPTTLPARTWHILPDATGDAPTIQAGIDSAAAGDTVSLGNGVFTGTGNRDIDFAGRAILVSSESGIPDSCVIDCGATPADPHRGFFFHSSEGPSSVLRGVRITNGIADRGGAIRAASSSPAIRECVFDHDSAGTGCALWALSCSIRVEQCVFRENRAAERIIVYLDASDPTVSGCRFVENGTTGAGFALYLKQCRGLFADCTFERNLAHGLQCWVQSRSPEFVGCSFIDNVSSYQGGGAYIVFAPGYPNAFVFRRCLFAGNRAPLGGGISAFLGYEEDVHPYEPPLVLDSCTIVENFAPIGAGISVHAEWAYAVIENTTIAFNDSSQGLRAAGVCPLISCTDIWGNEGGDWTGCYAALLGTNGNISSDPLFCDAAGGDFTLDAASPCLNTPGCGRIGAFGQGCDVATSVASGPLGGPIGWTLLVSPNPSAGAFTVRYDLPSPTIASLAVFDIAGRLVRTLDASDARGAATWDGKDGTGRNAAPGVYFVRVTSRDFTDARRVMLVR